MQPTGDVSMPSQGNTFKTGPRAQPQGFAIPDPPGGRIIIPGNYDTSPAVDAGAPDAGARLARNKAERQAVAGAAASAITGDTKNKLPG